MRQSNYLMRTMIKTAININANLTATFYIDSFFMELAHRHKYKYNKKKTDVA